MYAAAVQKGRLDDGSETKGVALKLMTTCSIVLRCKLCCILICAMQLHAMVLIMNLSIVGLAVTHLQHKLHFQQLV